MRVELYNIQAIESAVYELSEVGVTQIVGENNNGKSILMKSMSFVANTLIKNKEDRFAMIRDNTSSGVILMSRKGMTLKVTISVEPENCRYDFINTDGKRITRTLREGGLDILAEKFGWISFEGNICLQIYQTFGIMPFVNNRETSDYQIIDYIITDKVASEFVESYEKITYPKFRETVGQLKTTSESLDKQLRSITIYDVERYEHILHKLKQLQRNIAHLHTIDFEPIEVPKALKFANVVSPIDFKPIPVFYQICGLTQFSPIERELSEYSQVMNGVCPMCGTSLKDIGGTLV